MNSIATQAITGLKMTPLQVHRAWKARLEIVLVDLREERIHALGHPLFATNLPLSRLELGIGDAIPRLDTPVVLFDGGMGLVDEALRLLCGWGYRAVSSLDGDLAGWRSAGLELFEDVNSPSKAFGELVEHYAATPHVRAEELQQLIDAKADIAILDARRYDEYATMTIPGSISVPGAELVMRAQKIAPDPQTTIIVNCAGRTRSIIGAQSLINAGLPNPVRALRNGTIGWTLADQKLELGQTRRYPEVDTNLTADAARRARQVAYRCGVRIVGQADLDAIAACRTLYRFDVRSAEEFAARHLMGFRHAPGGQLVQETDMFAPVRGATIVVFDDLQTRAFMTASWLAQMGWDALVLDPEQTVDWAPHAQLPRDAPAPDCRVASVEDAERMVAGGALLLDFATSIQFRKGHIPGAGFVMRSRVGADLPSEPRDRPVLLTSPDGRLAHYAVPAVAAALGKAPMVIDGGTRAWAASGRPMERGDAPAFSPAEDVYRRPYEGVDNPRDKMQAYLDWEYGLIAQLERDGSHGFFVIGDHTHEA